MGLRDRVKRVERAARGEMIEIPQPDGTVKRFPESDLAPAYLDAFDRTVGRSDPDEPGHPLCAAARNSSDLTWRGSFYASGDGRTEAAVDLSE